MFPCRIMRGGTMASEDLADLNRNRHRFSSLRGGLLAAFAGASFLVLATFNYRNSQSKPSFTVASTASASRVTTPAKALPKEAFVRKAAAARLASLPMDFEPNRGQVNARAKYIARGAGYSVFLTRDEAVISLEKFRPRKITAAPIRSPNSPSAAYCG